MGFEVAAEAYGRFMGRFSRPLAREFIDWVEVDEGRTALDVGCGTGALTGPLIDRLGVENVRAIDPSHSFVSALQESHPEWNVRLGAAESIPFADATFDLTLAQLVVHFMADPVGGLREMARVTRPGGTVAACVWDSAGLGSPLAPFWRAARDLDPGVDDESGLPGVREGQLAVLFQEAGMSHPESTALRVSARCETFEEWWTPFTLGVGPAGAYVESLQVGQREALRLRCFEQMPAAPFAVEGIAWSVRCVGL